MAIQLAKDSFDLGVVTRDFAAMLAFYRDVVGLEDIGNLATRPESRSSVRQLRCGTAVLKLVELDSPPVERAPIGGVTAATGMRLLTLVVEDLQEALTACVQAGRHIIAPITRVNPTTSVVIVEDPDGNAVEFMQIAN